MNILESFSVNEFLNLIKNIIAGLVLLFLFYYAGKKLIRGIFNARIVSLGTPVAKRRLQTAATLLTNIWKYFLLLIALIVIVSSLKGVAIPAVVITAVLGSALGFGAQSFLRDIIAGFSIIFEGQFAVGDKVELSGVDVLGVVKEVGLRVTILEDERNNVIYVPNGEIKVVKNLGQPPSS